MKSFISSYSKSSVEHFTSSSYIMGIQKRRRNHEAFLFYGKFYEATKPPDALHV